jgi:hypothetical protein
MIHKSHSDFAAPEAVVEPVHVVSATAVERAVEREVVEDVRELRREFVSPVNYGPLAFYFLSSLVCVAALAYLFGSIASGVFFAFFGLFLWHTSHEFHNTRTGLLKSFIFLGSLVALLYFFYWVFNDTLSLLLCIIYALSFVVAAVLYFYHVKRELSEEIHRSFPRTFLVMFYSHMIAFTAASVLAYVLPLVLLGDSFVSMTYLVVAWALPVTLVYYFLTKFLYLRFFDRKHVKRDFLKGLAHGLAYAAVFTILVVVAYVLTAIQFVWTERAVFDETFSEVFTALPNVKAEISSVAFTSDDADLLGMRVTQEIIMLSDQALQDVTELKRSVSTTQFSFGDYFSDNYFSVFVNDGMALSHLTGDVASMVEVKSDLLREYTRLKEMERVGMFDGDARTLQEHYYGLASYVGDARFIYKEPSDVASLKQKLASRDSYSVLMGDGKMLEFNMKFMPDIEVLAGDGSRFSQRFYVLLHHTILFRDIMVLVFDTVSSQVEEVLDPYAVGSLYQARSVEESMESKVLRYRILRSNYDALLAVTGL